MMIFPLSSDFEEYGQSMMWVIMGLPSSSMLSVSVWFGLGIGCLRVFIPSLGMRGEVDLVSLHLRAGSLFALLSAPLESEGGDTFLLPFLHSYWNTCTVFLFCTQNWFLHIYPVRRVCMSGKTSSLLPAAKRCSCS